MIAFYYETRDVRSRIEGLLEGAEFQATDCREAFNGLLRGASVAIVGLAECSQTDVTWLRAAMGQGFGAPPCILVTPLSLGRLQRLRRIRSNRFQVVWAEEIEDQLARVLDRIEPYYLDPLQRLGHRLLRDHSLHWSLVKAIRRTCGGVGDPRAKPPLSSVSDLARHAKVPPDAFRRYWRTEMPLRCSPKEFLSWVTLLWAVRQRRSAKWDTIAARVGVRRRTLERYSVRLTDRTLAVAARDPALVQRRFERWVAQVSVVPRPAPPKTVTHPLIQRRSTFDLERQHRQQPASGQIGRRTVNLADWLAARDKRRREQQARLQSSG